MHKSINLLQDGSGIVEWDPLACGLRGRAIGGSSNSGNFNLIIWAWLIERCRSAADGRGRNLYCLTMIEASILIEFLKDIHGQATDVE